jgi:hypothetical protein
MSDRPITITEKDIIEKIMLQAECLIDVTDIGCEESIIHEAMLMRKFLHSVASLGYKSFPPYEDQTPEEKSHVRLLAEKFKFLTMQ